MEIDPAEVVLKARVEKSVQLLLTGESPKKDKGVLEKDSWTWTENTVEAQE